MIFNAKIRQIREAVKEHVLISGYKHSAKYKQGFILLFMEFSDYLLAKHFSINFEFCLKCKTVTAHAYYPI